MTAALAVVGLRANALSDALRRNDLDDAIFQAQRLRSSCERSLGVRGRYVDRVRSGEALSGVLSAATEDATGDSREADEALRRAESAFYGDVRRKLEIVGTLAARFPDEAQRWAHDRGGALDPAHCILAAKTGLEVLRYFGLEARELLVTAWACNELMRDEMRAVVESGATATPEIELVERGAWMVSIDTEDDPESGRFPGHLVLAVERSFLLDLNAGQFARPAKRIAAPPVFGAILELEWKDWTDTAVFDLDDGGWLAYQPSQHVPRTRWTSRGDWKRTNAIAGRLIRAIRKEIS